jgi:hypothetical protein
MVDRKRVSHEAVRSSLQMRREPLPNDAHLPRLYRLYLGSQVSLAPTVLPRVHVPSLFSLVHSYIRLFIVPHAIGHSHESTLSVDVAK